MNNQITESQIQSYQKNGFVIIEDFLSPGELAEWRKAVEEAIQERDGRKFPGQDIKVGEDDGINEDAGYYGKVFDQLLNLWQTSQQMKKLMLDSPG
jgi:ectoine hydroxylase-related dioxygenase (phytanoyl-CoA dioxygenase family)